MLLILAPSKTQKFISRDFFRFTQPLLLEKSCFLADHLKSLSRPELADIMKLSKKLTDETYNRIHNFTPPLTIRNSRQAIFTFQGDAYSQLNPGDYSEEELLYSQKYLHILSGLYGILRPLDLIFPYRLEMGLKLNIPAAGNLYHYWGDEPTRIINSSLTETDSTRLVNLASTEYIKAVNRQKLDGELITVVFKQKKNGNYKTIPIYAKKARGLMTHFAIVNRIEKADDLKSFDLDGYIYSRNESTKGIWLFKKELD
ncbi:MAG: peroxide stress protein YaaA [Deltaproteobacteria bacterium]|nr:peroxide stress protein YaaA [Deltaproteobacteria bacterium]